MPLFRMFVTTVGVLFFIYNKIWKFDTKYKEYTVYKEYKTLGRG